MGQPSLAIYVNELIQSYGAARLIRIGSCGSIQPEVKLRDLIIAMSASTDSAMNDARFGRMHFAPTASPSLFLKAVRSAEDRKLPIRIGQVLASDSFYPDDPDGWRLWADYGVLAIEMETAMLYTLAARHQVDALSILTVSDSIPSGETTTAEERRSTFTKMVDLALSLVEP